MKSRIRARNVSSGAARTLTVLGVLLGTLLATQPVFARGATGASDGLKRYIVELQDPPLARFENRQMAVKGALGVLDRGRAQPKTAAKLDLSAPVNREYLQFLLDRQEAFLQPASARLGRELAAVFRFRLAANGMVVDLTPDEAAGLARLPGVKSIVPDERLHLDTDAGPAWIGAPGIWDGSSGFSMSRGENVVVGVIDSGINWDHPSFADPSPDGYVYSNPLGQQLGLCDDPEVLCNNKLIGVYDFVEDDPDTEDVVEEYTKGRDNDLVGHGTHVASTAVGNRLNVTVNGSSNVTVSGVAPRANLVTYRVCFTGEPADADSGGCALSATLAAVEQAIEDGVDVLNYSVGSSAIDPWASRSGDAFLNARNAGIVVVSSAGNSGPESGTVGSPANAPWVIAVGNASHNRLFALGFDLSGGPAGLPCVEGNGDEVAATVGPQPVVFAGDVGDALGCSAFPAGSMEGSIALISRGSCLFETKADNAAAAGADFMVVYNNVGGLPVRMDLGGADLPSCMISQGQGVEARDYVQSNPAATGRVTFPVAPLTNDEFGDILAHSSSRGPAQSPVEDTLKPNVIAPGTSIYAASQEGDEFRLLSGTSMASPHIAGAAALLKSVHSDWSPSQVASAIETTATAASATLDGTTAANPRERGAGRPQLAAAANAGLYLDVSASEFASADPRLGGDPMELNLPGLVNAKCVRNCTFERTVTDQMGGGDWTATALDFPPGVNVTIAPPTFELSNGGSQSVSITVDVEDADALGEWVDGRIELSAAGSPDQYLTVSVLSAGGDLPATWPINDDRDGGWTEFALSGLVALPDATFRSGGLQPAERTVEVLEQDPSDDDPYDGGAGVFTKWHSLPNGALWLYAETLASTATDLDLFVGRDDNGNGLADESEELCSSTSPEELERCDLFDLPSGEYWVLVQNWLATEPDGDEVTLLSSGIAAGDGTLAASGPGIVDSTEEFTVRLSWDNLAALPGEEWLGAVGIGTRRSSPNNIGVIPVVFRRTGIHSPETFALYDGVEHNLAVDAGAAHDRLFIDVPPGASSLTVSAAAVDDGMNDGLSIELRRLSFADALVNPPFAAAPSAAQVVASDSGSAQGGPSVTVSGSDLQAGRWYAVLSNDNDTPAAVGLRADTAFAGAAAPIHRGLWEPNSRPGLGQGYEYNWGDAGRALVWYSYEEDGQPAWYIAGSPSVAGNIWVSDLYRVTNDGARQQLATVGRVSVTTLAEDDALFTFTLFGQSGTDRMQPLSPLTCPEIGGEDRSYTGLWYRGVDGLGGASVVVNAVTQAQIHYLFDDNGRPRWLVAQEPSGQGSPTATDLPMLQFTGYCAVCADTGVSWSSMGVLTRAFRGETTGTWTLDYLLQPPLSGDVERTDQIVKLTGTLECR